MEENKITFQALYESIQEVMTNPELSEQEKVAQVKDLTSRHNLLEVQKDVDTIVKTSSVTEMLDEEPAPVEKLLRTSLIPRLYHNKGKWGEIAVNIASGQSLFIPSRTHTLLLDFSNGAFFGAAYEVTAAELLDLFMAANLPKVERLKRL